MTDQSRPLFLAMSQHDRAVERRGDDEWLQQRWNDPTCRAILVAGSDVEVDADQGRPRWRSCSDVTVGDRYLLGVDVDGGARFAVHVTTPESTASFHSLREVAVSVGDDEAAWLCHAVALAQWHATHTHCPRCGGPTVVAAGGAERRCPADGSSHFPRVDPAVIVLVTDEQDRALLGHQSAWPTGRFSTLAGFVEPGESAEHAVRREVAEEAGVDVIAVELLATQPWPFPSSLMIGAVARVAGSPEVRPDGVEIAEARWFSRDDLRAAIVGQQVLVPGPISISRWLIERWYGSELPDDRVGWR